MLRFDYRPLESGDAGFIVHCGFRQCAASAAAWSVSRACSVTHLRVCGKTPSLEVRQGSHRRVGCVCDKGTFMLCPEQGQEHNP